MDGRHGVVLDVAIGELLGEPNEPELIRSATDSLTNWSFKVGGDYDRARRIFANRRVQYSAKPDPRREAATEYIKSKKCSADNLAQYIDDLIAVIDATVRKADKEG